MVSISRCGLTFMIMKYSHTNNKYITSVSEDSCYKNSSPIIRGILILQYIFLNKLELNVIKHIVKINDDCDFRYTLNPIKKTMAVR